MSHLPSVPPAPISDAYPTSTPSLKGVVVFWLFVAVTVITMTTLGISLKGGRIDVVERIVWDIGWLGWVPLTYLILRLCRRHPIERRRKLPTLARLALYGVGIVGVQIAIDFTCNGVFGWLLRGTPFTASHLLYIAVFKAHIYYGVYWMIVGAAHAYEYHRRFQQGQLVASQLETKLATAELARLKVQLQPHFLFNAHHTIVALMLKNENQAAIRMLTRLSDLLRLSLARSGQQLVAVADEIAALRLYLEIQQERFRDRLRVTVDVPADVEDAEIPHLLLQPLVENALVHGLEEEADGATLEIMIARESDHLVCRVRDNGAGFAPAASPDGESVGAGIGLSNTRERLQQLYGTGHSLRIDSCPGSGCTVTLHLPYRRHASASSLSP